MKTPNAGFHTFHKFSYIAGGNANRHCHFGRHFDGLLQNLTYSYHMIDPDPQAVCMGMVLELWPAWEVYLDWFPLCPVAHGMDCCLGYAPWQWDHTWQTHLLGKCKTRTLCFISPTEQAAHLDSGWEGRLAPCFSVAITVLWKENGLRSQKQVQIPQLPLWYKSKTK